MGLAPDEKKLLGIVRAAAVGDQKDLRSKLNGISPSSSLLDRILEGFLQMHLFVGYPAMIESLRVLHEEHPDSSPRPERSREEPENHLTRGQELCRRIYGETYQTMIETMKKYHPDLPVWIERDGYGRVMARGGLPGRLRELITVLLLATTDFPRQLESHLQGALRLGATENEIGELFEFLLECRETDLSDSCKRLFQQYSDRHFS